VGPHRGRGLADPGGQQRTTRDSKRRGQRPFGAIDLGCETPGVSFHTAAATRPPLTGFCILPGSGREESVSDRPDSADKRLARMPQRMMQCGQHPPAATAATPPPGAGGDVETTARALLQAAAMRRGASWNPRRHLNAAADRALALAGSRERGIGGRTQAGPPPASAWRCWLPRPDQPLLGRGSLPQRAASLDRPAPGSKLVWRRCSFRRLAERIVGA
jgi:hypothetical protein